MDETVRFEFLGQLQGPAFAEFARHRAARLDLALTFAEVGDASVSLTVAGPPDLVDAFEMACSLGPYECLVLDVRRFG